MTSADILAALMRMNARLDELYDRPAPQADVILTRDEAARQLKVSVRQLQRLVRAGRLLAHPSGIARSELERYAKTPQTRLTAGQHARRHASVAEDAAEGRELLKLRRKRRVT